MSEAKEKDKILAQIKALVHHSEIDGISRHIDALKTDGYVSVAGDEQGGIIVARITPQGERFLENGGYASILRHKRMATVRKGLKWALVTVIGAALTVLTTLLLSRWLST